MPLADHRASRSGRAAVAVWLALARTPSASPAAAQDPPPSLVVLVVADGLSWEAAWSRKDRLGGGLGQLLREGRVESECRYRHLNTLTGPGHASLATGAPPRVHGIVGNEWREVAEDGSLRTVCSPVDRIGPAPRGGCEPLGPRHLRAATIGDRLAERWPASRVVSIGGKGRAAALLAGRAPGHIVYWQSIASGRFTTGPPYAPATPAAIEAARIVSRFNDERIGSEAGLWLSRIARSGFRLLEGLFTSRGVRGSAAPLTVLFSNPLATDLALELLESAEVGLGRDEVPDLLCLAYSETDAVFHRYGIFSPQADDAVLRLDRELARLLDGLRQILPSRRVLLALSADHGFLPETSVRKGAPRSLAAEIERRVRADLCLDRDEKRLLVAHGWAVWYDPSALPAKTAAGPCGPAGRAVGPGDLGRALAGAAGGALSPYIEAVLLRERLAEWDGTPQAEFARNLLAPGREADAYMFPREGVLAEGSGRGGSSHGSHHDYDTRVPLVLWGTGIASGFSKDPSAPYDLAPTLAARLGIALPDATGRDLLDKRRVRGPSDGPEGPGPSFRRKPGSGAREVRTPAPPPG